MVRTPFSNRSAAFSGHSEPLSRSSNMRLNSRTIPIKGSPKTGTHRPSCRLGKTPVFWECHLP